MGHSNTTVYTTELQIKICNRFTLNSQSLTRTTNEGSDDKTTPGLSRYKSANVTIVFKLMFASFVVIDTDEGGTLLQGRETEQTNSQH